MGSLFTEVPSDSLGLPTSAEFWYMTLYYTVVGISIITGLVPILVYIQNHS